MADTSIASDDLSTRLAAGREKIADALKTVHRHFHKTRLTPEVHVELTADQCECIMRMLDAALVPAPTEAARGLAVTEDHPNLARVAAMAAADRDVIRQSDGLLFGDIRAALRTSPPETVGGGDALREALKDLKAIVEMDDWWSDPSDANYPLRFEIEAALSSAPPAEETWQAPDGWQLVPIKATPQMVHAMRYGRDAGKIAIGQDPMSSDDLPYPYFGPALAVDVYDAALKAAPLPPGPAGEAK